MTGWLIVNGFLDNRLFDDLYISLLNEARYLNSELKLIKNTEFTLRADTGRIMHPDLCTDRPDYVLFWDKDIRLARALESAGIRVFNNPDAIRICDDKALTFSKLSGIVRMPVTYNVPFTYETTGYIDTAFLDNIEASLKYPYVLKECFGSFGTGVYLIQSRQQCTDVLRAVSGRPCIIQEYIGTGAVNGSYTGQDVRIYVVGDRCVAAMKRSNDHDFRANIAGGGHAMAYTPCDEECMIALKVCNALKLDHAGVDILTGSDGAPVLCEVNSNAHFKGLCECTGVNIPRLIIENAIKQGGLS